jgi:hypothetical protein
MNERRRIIRYRRRRLLVGLGITYEYENGTFLNSYDLEGYTKIKFIF